jgi:cytoskeleton protein RodZ
VWWVINLSGDNVQPAPARSTLASNSSATASVAGSSNTDDTNTASQAGTGDNQSPVSQSATAGPHGQQAASKPAAKVTASAGAAPGAPRANSPANAAPTLTNTPPAARVTTTTPVSNTPATVPNPSPRPKDGELTLRFSSDSWAEVYDASGQRLFYDVGTASSAHTVRGPAPLRVVLGNASGVAVEYNGRPALIPASNQPDGSARFVINAHGRATPASATAPNGD